MDIVVWILLDGRHRSFLNRHYITEQIFTHVLLQKISEYFLTAILKISFRTAGSENAYLRKADIHIQTHRGQKQLRNNNHRHTHIQSLTP